MLPDRVSNPGPLTYESGALPIALRGPQRAVKPRTTTTTSFSDTCILYRNNFVNKISEEPLWLGSRYLAYSYRPKCR